MAVKLEKKNQKLIKLKVNMLAEVDGKTVQCGVGSVLEVSEEFGNQCNTFQQSEDAPEGSKPKLEPLQRVSMLPPINGETGERFESWAAFNGYMEKLNKALEKVG